MSHTSYRKNITETIPRPGATSRADRRIHLGLGQLPEEVDTGHSRITGDLVKICAHPKPVIQTAFRHRDQVPAEIDLDHILSRHHATRALTSCTSRSASFSED